MSDLQTTLRAAFKSGAWTPELKRATRQIFSAIVTINSPLRLDPDKAKAALQEEARAIGVSCTEGRMADTPGARAVLKKDWLGRPTKTLVNVNINGVEIIITAECAPMEGDGEKYGESGKIVFSEAKSSIAVVEHSLSGGSPDYDFAYDRAAAVMLATSALFRCCTPFAVLWNPACQALSAEMFKTNYDMLRGTFPAVQMWARTFTRSFDGGLVVFTNGLLPFFGFEMEAVGDSEVTEEDLTLLLYNSAGQLFDRTLNPFQEEPLTIEANSQQFYAKLKLVDSLLLEDTMVLRIVVAQ